MTNARAPRHLEAATRRWWDSVLNDYELGEHHLHLLQLACEAWDRCQAARAALGAQGLTYVDKFGNPRPRPEIAIERDSRIAFARLVREMDLDTEQVPEGRRPPALRSNRR